MLSKELKERNLHSHHVLEDEARTMLERAVLNLTATMRAIELDGYLTRSEVEMYVLTKMEEAEILIYSMDEERFSFWLDSFIEEVRSK